MIPLFHFRVPSILCASGYSIESLSNQKEVLESKVDGSGLLWWCISDLQIAVTVRTCRMQIPCRSLQDGVDHAIK